MAEDVVEGFLGGDLAAGDFGEDIEDIAEIFGEEVTADTAVKAFDDAMQTLLGTAENFVVAGAGDDDARIGDMWGGGNELLLENVNADTVFGLERVGLVLDAYDGLVVAEGNVRVGDGRL